MKEIESPESDSSLYQRLCENLRQMPIMVTSTIHDTSSETIVVSWTDLDGDVLSRLYGLDPTCRITLHRESTCSGRRDDLLLSDRFDHQISVGSNSSTNDTCSPCGCPEKVVSQKDFGATFSRLNLDEAYFPMIARNDFQAFFGLPPRSLKPQTIQVPVNESRTRIVCAARRRTPTRASVDTKDDFTVSGMGDLYGVSDDDESSIDAMHCHSPSPRPSHRNLVNNSGLSPRPLHRSVTPVAPLTESPRARSLNRPNGEMEQLSAKIRSLEADIEEKDQHLATLKSECNFLLTQCTEKQQEAKGLRSQLQLQKDALASQQQHKSNMEEEISQTQLQLEAKDQLLQHTRESLRASEQQRVEQDRAVAENREKSQNLKEKLRIKSDALLQASSDNESLAAQLETATVRCLAQIRQIDEGNANIKKLDEDLRISNLKLQTQQEEIDELTTKISNLQQGEPDDGENVDFSLSRFQHLESANTQLRTQRLNLKNKIIDLERRLRDAEDAYDTQLRLAAETARRRDLRLSSVRPKSERGNSDDPIRPKRERDDDDEDIDPTTSTSRCPKRCRINGTEGDTIDLTGA
ncbi:hypothetical protein ONS96_000565 [Cadophora gregata f. sp. sojae]|nr:hypothetical protein ONS96_000565 [Cadophora gregata f. sp. sojae]